MTKRTKRKTEEHITEKKSLAIIESILPDFWSIREYKPDYGIDIAVELFEEKNKNKRTVYDTLGEHIYIQVKGTKETKISKHKIYSRNNIENSPLEESNHYKEIDVIKFSIDVIELNTIQRMGSAFPVLLFLVNTTEKRIFFLCINDYIDKVLLPHASDYIENKTKTLYIPVANEITRDSSTLLPIYLYAKRPKYHAFFSKVTFQNNEFHYCPGEQIVERAKHYASLLLHYDVWDQKFNWATLSYFYDDLKNVAEKGETLNIENQKKSLNNAEKVWDRNGDERYVLTEYEMRRSTDIIALWHQLSNINNVFEGMSREWFLPTYMFS